MAVPIYPIEIWAADDYTLPNAHTKNKKRPITDLWTKGYDKGQRPNVQAWNYLWYMQTTWLKYISEEQVPNLDNRFLKRDLNLTDLTDVPTARNSLEVFSKTESDQRFVNVEGDIMTGPLTLPRLNFAAGYSDFANIEAVSPYADKTFFDFNLGDNAGDKNAAGNVVDVFRWRFTPTGGQATSLMELNMQANGDALLEIAGTGSFKNLYIGNGLDTYSLNVRANQAVVGGQHVVRTVNNYGADANGNVVLPQPPSGVLNMRLGAEYDKGYVHGAIQRADPGGVLTGLREEWQDNEIHQYFFRPVQVTFDGINWYTVSQV